MHHLFLASSDPIGHVIDKNLIGQHITLSMVSLVVALVIAVWVLSKAARSISTGPESLGNERYVSRERLGQIVESIVLYIREETLIPVMGARLATTWAPFLLSLFFFVLFLNFFGLIPFGDFQEATFIFSGSHPHFEFPDSVPIGLRSPIFFGGTATASILVTAGLATVSLVAILWQSFRELGFLGTLEHLCGGAELTRGSIGLWLIVPLIFAVELAGMIIKPSALAIRLFANMVAGHTLLAVLFGFGAAAAKAGMGAAGVASITLISGAFAVIISFLELFVALLQAFIFMFLTAVFISLMAHHDEHAHEEEHGHGTSEAPAH